MLELPCRPSTVTIEVKSSHVELVFEPLTRAQYLRFSDVGTVVTNEQGEAVDISYRIAGDGEAVFWDRLREIKGLLIDGAPFDKSVPSHVDRIPPVWVAVGIRGLIRHANDERLLTEAEQKN